MEIRVHNRSSIPKVAFKANNPRSTQELVLRVRLSPQLLPQRLKIQSNVIVLAIGSFPESHP